MRKRVLSSREAAEPDKRASWSRTICQQLGEIPEVATARLLMAYVPVRNEVDISEFWLARWNKGQRIALPVVVGNQLEAVEFTGWVNTREGAFGIKEPVGEPLSPELVDAVLVPGVVFDRHGWRLGYGKGFYDRFLPRLPQTAFTCGIAFELQVVDSIIPAEHDIRLKALVTEAGREPQF
ncbi:MAG: 5-formyltetrahydrofolate cyclo-ligase [Chitinophagales bacterium]